MKRILTGIAAGVFFMSTAFADTQMKMAVQVSADRKPAAATKCFISEEKADQPSGPPYEVDCDCVELPGNGEYTLIVKVMTAKSLVNAIENLKAMTGGGNDQE